MRATARPPLRSGDAGFTLMEVLVAMAILALVTGILFGTFSQSARLKRRTEATQTRNHTARLAMLRMAREIEMAFLSDADDPSVQVRRTFFTGEGAGEDTALTFSWFGHQRLRYDAPEGDTSVVSYFLADDPDERGVVNLMRRETRHIASAEPEQIPGETYIMCPDVVELSLSFYDFVNKEWEDSWDTRSVDSRDYLPSHVRITLVVLDEYGREETYFTAARIEMTEKVAYRPFGS